MVCACRLASKGILHTATFGSVTTLAINPIPLASRGRRPFVKKRSFIAGGCMLAMLAAVVYAQDRGGTEKTEVPPENIQGIIMRDSLQSQFPMQDLGQENIISWRYSAPSFTKAQLRLVLDGNVLDRIEVENNQQAVKLEPRHFGGNPPRPLAPRTVQVVVVPYDIAGKLKEGDALTLNLQVSVNSAPEIVEQPPETITVKGSQPVVVRASVRDLDMDRLECRIELEGQPVTDPVEVNGQGEVTLTFGPNGPVPTVLERTYWLVVDDLRPSSQPARSEFKVRYMPEDAVVAAGAPKPEAEDPAPAAPDGSGPTGPLAGGPTPEGPRPEAGPDGASAPEGPKPEGETSEASAAEGETTVEAGPDTAPPPADTAPVSSNRLPMFAGRGPILSPRGVAHGEGVVGGKSIAVIWDAPEQDEDGDPVSLVIRLRDPGAAASAEPVVTLTTTDRRAVIRTPYVREERRYTLEVALFDGKEESTPISGMVTLMPVPADVTAVVDEVRFRDRVVMTLPTQGHAVTQANGLMDPAARRRSVQHRIETDDDGRVVIRRE